ncbi:hypothetical protein CI109_104083 [Kwoniella shandongensis]|uniref:Uncharacterized protein n=1 Tax=Kwoniella shandongensis TaxID=1734106 RepID=A0A5M6BXP6_9TREE|nr:uncharacterized protein CI109_004031 [Kwoniella shandongensis]KAA5527493.1 hypothetical protein CI109_004031 [Kwoniella shandongensis]
MEAKLQKLKVTELKELLAKHHLVQTGKKDDLVKRLLDNNVSVEDGPEEELVDPDASTGGTAAPPSGPAVTAAPAAPEPVSTSQEASSSDATTTALEPTPTPINDTLTPEQQAMKARAERFGIPFNPDAKPKSSSKPKSSAAAASPAPTAPAAAAAPAPTQPPKQKAGAIDSNPLGLSEEVLARRAAKFGLPEKKAEPVKPAAATDAAPAPTPAAKKVEEKPKEEISPELAEKIAIEEEKKRKRAEKFGTIKPASEPAAANGTNGSSEPDAKKAKV